MSNQEQMSNKEFVESTSFRDACSFCGVDRNKSRLLITGPMVSICSLCVEDAAKVVNEYKDTHGHLSLLRTS